MDSLGSYNFAVICKFNLLFLWLIGEVRFCPASFGLACVQPHACERHEGGGIRERTRKPKPKSSANFGAK